MDTHKDTVYSWMDENYTRENRTIRSIWYEMKAYIQDCNKTGYKRGGNLTDKSTTAIIGAYLWSKFVDGDYDIYGRISNSGRVKAGELPVVLFTEKNTLLPFGENLSNHITSFEYNASGQTNSYEIANIILQLQDHWNSELYIFGVTDFDNAGENIYATVVEKFSNFFDVIDDRFATELDGYETFIQPNKTIGVELDAIDDLQPLVYGQLEEFLPTYLFEELAVSYKRNIVFNKELRADEKYQKLGRKLENRENKIRKRVLGYEYIYNFDMTEKLNNLPYRVEIKQGN